MLGLRKESPGSPRGVTWFGRARASSRPEGPGSEEHENGSADRHDSNEKAAESRRVEVSPPEGARRAAAMLLQYGGKRLSSLFRSPESLTAERDIRILGLLPAGEIVARLRWLAVASWGVLVLFSIDQTGPRVLFSTWAVVAAYTAVAHWVVRRRSSARATSIGTMLGDSVAIALLCLVTGGLGSLGYPYFYIAVLGTSIRFGLAESCVNALVSGLLSVALYQAAAPPLGFVDLAVKVFYLFFIALLGGLLSREEKRQKGKAVTERDRSELLLSVNRAINSTLDFPELLQRIVDEGLRAIDCRGGCLVLLDRFGEKPRRVAVAGDFAMSAGYEIVASLTTGSVRLGTWRVFTGRDEIRSAFGAEIAGTVATQNLAILTLRRRHYLGFLALADPACGVFTDEKLVLLSALADQAAVAIENASLLEDGLRERDRKQRLLRRLIHSEEEERKRVAGEIHDSLGKRLFELHYGLRQCEEQLSDKDPLVAQILRRLDDEARGCADEIRAITNRLRPAVIDDFGFVAALKEYVETLKAQGEFAFVSLGIDCDVSVANRDANVMLFRVLHEAVLNSRKHARARHLWISFVHGEAGKLVLRIRDDGAGFDPKAIPRGHFGLLYMRERVEACNGAFAIVSAHGGGTEVSVLLPAERTQS